MDHIVLKPFYHALKLVCCKICFSKINNLSIVYPIKQWHVIANYIFMMQNYTYTACTVPGKVGEISLEVGVDGSVFEDAFFTL